MSNHQKLALLSLSILSIISLPVNATSVSEKYFLIAPHCLLKNINSDTHYKIVSETASLTLIETNQLGLQAFIEAKHFRTATPCGGFIDVTEERLKQHQSSLSFLKEYDAPSKKTSALSASNYTIQYPNQVNFLLNQFNAENMKSDLRAFTDTDHNQFPDRYPNSSTGIKAAQWLQNKIASMARENNRDDVTIYTVATGTRYKQPSVVVKIGDSNAPGIVIGAHMDTLESTQATDVKPGADDDGSGSMTVMGVARTLLTSGMHFKKPIYIIWYAAEEEGLVGSKYVVKDFVNKKIPVAAVMQFDMTGYAHQNNSAMWLINDYVNPDLTAYLAKLITTYVKQPVFTTRCGYACSDHASWTKAGFKSSFPFEAQFGSDNPYIHESTDTINLLSLSHMTDYAKLGIAFAVELAEPLE